MASGEDDARLATIVSVENAELDARIAAAPDELDSYLVYADWLQARGDPLGELITIQHALRDRPNDFDLIRAESRLIHGMPGHFLPADLVQLENIECQWRLGFLRRVSLFGNQSGLEKLLEHRSSRFLEELACEEWLAGEALTRLLSTLERPTLRSLSVMSGHAIAVPRAFLDNAPRLETLRIGEVPSGLDELVHPGLARLTLTASWGEIELDPLLEGTATPGLRELTLRGGAPENLRELLESPLLAQLSRLTLEACRLRDPDGQLMLQQRSAIEHLEHLGLQGNSLDRTEAPLRELGAWVDCGYQHFDATLLYE